MGCPKRLYIVVNPSDSTIQHEEIFDTLESAKAAITECVERGDYDLEDAEVWAATPLLRPKKVETIWEEAT